MGKNIFNRLLFTYAAVILVTVILLAALLTFFSNKSLYDQKQNQLLKAGHSLEVLAGDYFCQKIGLEELTRVSNALGNSTDSRIYVIDGKKIARLKSHGGQIPEGLTESALVEDIIHILEGKTVIRKKYYSDNLNLYFVFVGIPVYVEGEVRGVLMLLSPQENINATLIQIYKIIWGSAAISLSMAAIIIYLVSRQISRPIENMQKAAAAIAEGHFAEDIDIVGHDEVAKLAGTFNYMKNRLAVIEKMRRDLIANVSHELRTPLTSIRGFIQGILEGIIPPDQQEKFLKRAYNETGRLNRLVNDLLQMARLQTGNISLSQEKVNIGDLVNEITDEYAIMAREKNISIISTTEQHIITRADRDKLKQVLVNLIQNALNYSDQGGEVSIRTAVAGDSLIIQVKDTGSGIPPDHLDLIFEKFHRVEKSRSQHIPGTGLGLSIARELVNLHGGTIEAHSEVGLGTEFTIKLPFSDEDAFPDGRRD
ncbi:MAG: sensor histidine kinase [Bacillota bacterium]